MLNIDKQFAAMKLMTTGQLREKYADVFGESTNGRHKEWLIKRIAWRMQANAEGDLSERARRRAMEIANDADIRMLPPREKKVHSGSAAKTVTHQTKAQVSRELLPGTKLERIYKGRKIYVEVAEEGFLFEGDRYKSLTAVATAVTGKHWNGFHFFGLRSQRGSL
jgi:hypothetical protein